MTAPSPSSPAAPQGEHTPTPWRVTDPGPNAVVRGADGVIVAVRHRLPASAHQANVALIVRAVNGHDDLLAALKLFVETYEQLPSERATVAMANARAAIARAESV